MAASFHIRPPVGLEVRMLLHVERTSDATLSILTLLPLLCTLLICYSIWRCRPGTDPRSAFLYACVISGVVTTAITEVLSLFNALTIPALALTWGAATLAAAFLAIRCARRSKPRPPVVLQRPSLLTLVIGTPVVVIVLGTGLIAILGWPNSTDGLSYHLGRIAHWTQNQSLAFYPTHILHQLFYPPWAEYAMLHLSLLGGDERLANLVQWFSMLGSLIGVSLIARCLGATPRGQLFSAFFCATLPSGILEVLALKNDYVVAFWSVCLAYALLALRTDPTSTIHRFGAGASLGLLLLTKGSAYILGPSLLLLMLLAGRPLGKMGFLKQVTLIGFVALAINVPHYFRNFELFGSFLGPGSGTSGAQQAGTNLANEAFTVPILVSNLVRNTALHLGTPLPAVNSAVESAITEWHAWLGMDVNDRRNTWKHSTFRVAATVPRHGQGGNPVHLLLIGVSVVALAWSGRLRRHSFLGQYILVLVSAFVLFSLLLKWQTSGSRLVLAVFVLSSPLVGIALQQHARSLVFVAVVLAGAAGPFLMWTHSHPLLGPESVLRTDRTEQYFRLLPSLRAGYLGAAEFIEESGCTQVGLHFDWTGSEYPFWRLLPWVQEGAGRIEHVAVTNSSARLESHWPSFTPCVVIKVRGQRGDKLEVAGQVYRRAWSRGVVTVLVPDRPPSQRAT